MAELKKYLDTAGLQVLWDQAKAKFIDNGELTTILSSYEKIEDLERDYFNKSQIQAKIDELASIYATQTALAEEVSRAQTEEAKKPDKEIITTDGKAMLWNESSGGGAKFEHTDGTWSFTGVNNGGADGLAAQIYAVDSTNGYKGAKLDVTKGGIYYTTGETSGLPVAQRDVEDNELVVKKDIKDIAGGMHFIGVVTQATGETIEAAIERVYTEAGKTYADRKAGDVVIIKTTDSDREFVCDSNKEWVELGDQGVYATKAELAAEAATRSEEDIQLQTNIDTETARAIAAEATKTTQTLTNANGKSQIMNESDGGGVWFTRDDNTSKSFLGVNDSTLGGPDAQIYAINPANGNAGAKIDILKTGMYYTVGSEGYSSRVVPANEIATVGKVVAKPVEPVAGQGVNVPYYFSVAYAADKATVTDYTVDLLDNTKAPATYNLDIVGATASAAGLMVATDKDKLDNIDTMTQAEIEDICK